jgi:FAD/FMN-containing dehydrogenase
MTTTAPHIASLARLAGSLAGRLVLPGDAAWDAARVGFNTALDPQPAAVVIPRDEADVITIVNFAREFGVRIAPQATGHNQAPLGSLAGTILVSTEDLHGVAIDPVNRRVRVGAATKWEKVVPQLSELGLAGLHGSSPDVGIAGYSLGGGMGWLARKYGLQTNSVTALELVTADGEFRRVDHDNEPDLFWALRGGNGNYGVVTAIEFSVYPLPEVYAGAMFFPFEQASEVLHAWREALPTFPEELMTWTTLMQFPDLPFVPEPVRGGSFAVVKGAYLGTEADGRELLRPVRALGPGMDTFAMVPPLALADLAMDPPDPLPIASTHTMLGELPASAIDALVEAAGPGSGSPLAMMQLRHMGGALSRPAPGAGARATLPGEVAMFSLGVTPDEHAAAAVEATLADVSAAVEPHRAVSDYPNFVEEPTDASRFFDEVTWARLRKIKRAYDPGDLFKGNHHIPPAAA